MNRNKPSFPNQVPQWAIRQLADFDARTPGTLFAEGLVLDVAQGYELQSAVAQLRQSRGEQTIGYKVGCTSPTIREQLGIDHCVIGRLFDSEHHLSGSTLSRSRFANLAIEGELAIEISRVPKADDFDGRGIPECVARVFPVIELHHHVMRGDRPSAGELIANNAIHAGFVAGAGAEPAGIDEELSLAVFADEEMIAYCDGPPLIQTINSSLKWLADVLHARGTPLLAGQIVLTGSVPSLIPIVADCHIKVEVSTLGSAQVDFTR